MKKGRKESKQGGKQGWMDGWKDRIGYIYKFYNYKDITTAVFVFNVL
jgi:hypothetical protein